MNDSPSALHDLQRAVHILRDGGLVVFPTETVYGLGADALNPDAVARVFALKRRPATNPLIVHVSGPDMARRVAALWPDHAQKLAAAFWPGPLSIIVPRRPDLPHAVTGGPASRGVALRSPDHPIALALLYHFDGPLVGPSANKSGAISPTTAQHVRDSFAHDNLFVLEGGPCATGIESTVVSLLDATPTILRAGVISAEQIAAVIRSPVQSFDHTITTPNDPATALPSPGILARHYAPSVPTRLINTPDLTRLLSNPPTDTSPRFILAHTAFTVTKPHALIHMPSTDAEYAAALYAALRHAESASPSEILIEHPPMHTPIWLAIWDRLRRASTPA